MCFSCHRYLHQALCDLRLNVLCSFFVFVLRHLQSFKEVISLTLSLLPLVSSPVGKKKKSLFWQRRGSIWSWILQHVKLWWKSTHRGVAQWWCCWSPADLQLESTPWVDSLSTAAFKIILCHCKLLPCGAKKTMFNSSVHKLCSVWVFKNLVFFSLIVEPLEKDLSQC